MEVNIEGGSKQTLFTCVGSSDITSICLHRQTGNHSHVFSVSQLCHKATAQKNFTQQNIIASLWCLSTPIIKKISFQNQIYIFSSIAHKAFFCHSSRMKITPSGISRPRAIHYTDLHRQSHQQSNVAAEAAMYNIDKNLHLFPFNAPRDAAALTFWL